MRVVKLGGSLADWERLPQCLKSLAALGVAIVPGGGPFADQVRTAQARWQFDEATAHDMALLAMCQFGRMLAGLNSRIGLAGTLADLRARVAEGRTTVWLPSPGALADEGIAASWDVTSDSLAVWLAARLAATEVILLKSALGPARAMTAAHWVAAGVVDRAFGRYAADASFPIWLCHREHYPVLGADQHARADALLRVCG